MPKFEVELRRIYIKTIIVEAEDEEQARQEGNNYKWNTFAADDDRDEVGTVYEIDEEI